MSWWEHRLHSPDLCACCSLAPLVPHPPGCRGCDCEQWRVLCHGLKLSGCHGLRTAEPAGSQGDDDTGRQGAASRRPCSRDGDGDARMAPLPCSGRRGGGAPTMTPHARRDLACHVWGARPVRVAVYACARANAGIASGTPWASGSYPSLTVPTTCGKSLHSPRRHRREPRSNIAGRDLRQGSNFFFFLPFRPCLDVVKFTSIHMC